MGFSPLLISFALCHARVYFGTFGSPFLPSSFPPLFLLRWRGLECVRPLGSKVTKSLSGPWFTERHGTLPFLQFKLEDLIAKVLKLFLFDSIWVFLVLLRTRNLLASNPKSCPLPFWSWVVRVILLAHSSRPECSLQDENISSHKEDLCCDSPLEFS